jgi:hypothetical protein
MKLIVLAQIVLAQCLVQMLLIKMAKATAQRLVLRAILMAKGVVIAIVIADSFLATQK